jgi:predicted TIM-barrel fold metal-dependent hydrolase
LRTGRQLRREFEAEGLAGAWIMTTDDLIGEVEKNNDILAAAVNDDLDLFVPFCTVDPHAGPDKAIAELVRAKDTLGMRGLKLHPWLQAFSLTHPAILPILDKAGQRKRTSP